MSCETTDNENIKRLHLVRAYPLTFEAYQNRENASSPWGSIQFRMTFAGEVLANMGEETAKFFSSQVQHVLGASDEVNHPEWKLTGSHADALRSFRATAQRHAPLADAIATQTI